MTRPRRTLLEKLVMTAHAHAVEELDAQPLTPEQQREVRNAQRAVRKLSRIAEAIFGDEDDTE